MVHPVITEIFSNEENVILFFERMSNQIKQKERLEEFFKWHLEVISEVINEIDKTTKIDFSEKDESENWAKEFLRNYDEKIRTMRKNSNQIFERFHELKTEFDKIIPKENQYGKESDEIMQVFLNKEELLIGKIIFAYRELWFVANQINDSNFKIGSINDYQEWLKTNYSNLKSVKIILQQIQHKILG
ncbi:hypothetical protein [Nitrosopumilus maritimus]|uniref:Uncharacterized protein n=1 Tax=Nitrosopumilus maritimus (strain SCM1) TaxID=436308 RepID=A9A4D5_NITMS|nr:hypothetical protein [Nitrosopumilus maritimus]ABX12624.1 hypothetical protein Nmar_0728 [Nitrosopumilus maritimus SCM1]